MNRKQAAAIVVKAIAEELVEEAAAIHINAESAVKNKKIPFAVENSMLALRRIVDRLEAAAKEATYETL